MRKFACAVLLAITTAAQAQYTFVLNYPDGSTQVCPSTGFSMNFDTVSVNVQDCVLDKVFSSNFGG
jgi:hypothetical protein